MEHWHLTFASKGRQHAFVDDAVRLEAVRAIARVLAKAAALFCVVDDHAHVVVAGTRADVGRLARGVLIALRAILPGVVLLPAHIEAVRDRSHLYTLVRYVLRQTEHHGLPWHPARWVGSCFADLVGARILSGFDPEALWRGLPRLALGEVLDAARVHRSALEPTRDEVLRDVGLRDIVLAAAAAVGRTAIAGKTPLEVGARRVAARLMSHAGGTTAQLAGCLGISERSARRLAHQPVDARLERAVRMQLTLRSTVPERRAEARMAS
ncbi:MAG: hypothetical protein JRJ84_18175 [Deltaproteobacteria bacterium]|nr:hypothetical protein [Deltaproteobacteria bacterium]